ncbi:(2Fe-2S)-binding protein [Moorella naiadis]|uniref:(2Fe-2S)-binding protein n=1 Tax=Moorella naiadis (nom. illeg.) TaxID=3093670 RepID=UPI003D9C86C8
MVSEVCRSEQKQSRKPCPACGRTGKGVAGITVASLLNAEAQEKLQATNYNLCLSPECQVVYYGDDGSIFTKDMVRVPVWFKEQSPRFICYCKNVIDKEILHHIVTRQCCHNLKDIQKHTGANTGHECLTKNPAGT